ncbi:heme ABC transporter ATP-binding protein [Rhodoblastus sphagnicola]|uniref:Heme ABC transporter ATP-binding protein n=1 Tax=Rhodoblastus sphagnicola TaxID=333368 RepID=A0A2S6NEE1_9HYPH|nr:heme ABC transporter ATP-binding protein [Rhodoblastus sphagnicola]MBB4200152.1 iron complex transport system ATP-binding protein [Rhodoblastus sphagnicola]PPQ33002.1 heme ABC transporter ATP-binding protein [Rhodoblastus sphagnicola]
MNAFIRAENLTYAVNGRKLIDSVSVGFDPGAFVAIIGPNGAGKSTLLRLLSGELRPSAGRIAWSGEPAEKFSPAQLALRRAVMAQGAALAFPYPVHEVARQGLAVVGRRLPKTQADKIVARALAVSGAQHLSHRNFLTLSGGEQQRARFARALCQLKAAQGHGRFCQALLLDEPTSSLDLEHQLALLGAARAIVASGVTVIAIVHDLNIAARFADRLVVLAGGRVVADGPAAQVIDEALVRKIFRASMRVDRESETGLPIILPQINSGRDIHAQAFLERF